MKEVLRPYQSEEAKYFCDKHPRRECSSELVLSSWYGSRHDMNVVKVHLCDECVEEMYALLKEKFDADPKEVEI